MEHRVHFCNFHSPVQISGKRMRNENQLYASHYLWPDEASYLR